MHSQTGNLTMLTRQIWQLYAHGRQLTIGAVRVLGTTSTISDVLDTQWITTPAFDFVEKWRQAAAVHHKRAIFYLKGEYFICARPRVGCGSTDP